MRFMVGLIIVGGLLAGVVGQFLPTLILLLLVRSIFRRARRQAIPQRPAPVGPVAPPQTVWMLVPVWMPPAPTSRPFIDAEVLGTDEGWR